MPDISFRINLRLVCLLLLVQLLAAGTVTAATRVFLCSRLEFTPALLDMLRRSFAQKLGVKDTIILQPVEEADKVAEEASGSLLLIEHGMGEKFLPAGYTACGLHLDLAWVMVASLRVPGLPIKQPLTGEKFVSLLYDLKKQSPDRYPWFESLSSRVTLRNFELLFNHTHEQSPCQHGISPASATARLLWQQKDAIVYLYRAIEEHLLNPFSIEADLGLAMNVFAADDAMFVSQWVPVEFLDDELLCQENLGKVRLLPFPVCDNQRYLRIRLCLYSKSGSQLRPESAVDAASGDYEDGRFIDLDYHSDMEWIEKKSADRYDALIMGDF
jgi:hypothetical protein